MKTISRLFLALLCGCFLISGICEAADSQQPPILSINGSGTAQGTPDEATISLGVITHAPSAEAAQSENAASSQAIESALADLGIAKKDIQTQNYSFYPDYSRDNDDVNVIVGYTVSNTILVRVDDVNAVGEVIDAALKNGANNINSLEFSIKNTDALRRTALKSAVDDAREKAEIIASSLGKSIVGVQNVSENTNMFRPRSNSIMLMAASKAMDSTPIEAGTLTMTADVHIDFIIAN
ncbi:MAG: SIMPL domain-containing protein [Selenomonadaceae bacterium]